MPTHHADFDEPSPRPRALLGATTIFWVLPHLCIRFADPDAAIAKIEAAFKAMDLKVKKMSATSTVAEEKIARCTESWQRGMEATLAMCTLRKDTVLMDKRTGATKVMNSMDQLKKTLAQFDPEDHGGQLECARLTLCADITTSMYRSYSESLHKCLPIHPPRLQVFCESVRGRKKGNR